MINPSSFLSRALLADAVFSGVSAVGLTLGAGVLAPFLNLPEALLRETSHLYGAGRGSAPAIGAEGAGAAGDRGHAAWTLASIALLFGAVNPNLLGRRRRGPGDRDRRVCRTAIYRLRKSGGVVTA